MAPQPHTRVESSCAAIASYHPSASPRSAASSAARSFASTSESVRPLLLGEVGIFQLINAFQNVIKRVEAREELQQIFGENYTVSDKIETILARVSEGGALKFSELFAEMASRVEIVVTFLALLELIRLKQVRAIQPGQFGEIEIAAAA